MTIQWFPGHMQEAESFLKETLSNVDIVIEIIDARLPISSSNPILDHLCKSAALRIKVLNKQDLADPIITEKWLDNFKNVNSCAAISITGTDSSDTWRALEFAISTFTLSKAVKSRSRRLRVMVVGIPNTGKSTIINTLAGRKVAKTGNVPAITRQQQRISLKNKVDIYDTPGILWPVLEDEAGAYKLAASGAISDAAIDYNDIAVFILKYLSARYPNALEERYKISNIDDINMILEKIGAARGCLKKGGIVDIQKASELIIRELRSGKLGRITLESPEDFL